MPVAIPSTLEERLVYANQRARYEEPLTRMQYMMSPPVAPAEEKRPVCGLFRDPPRHGALLGIPPGNTTFGPIFEYQAAKLPDYHNNVVLHVSVKVLAEARFGDKVLRESFGGEVWTPICADRTRYARQVPNPNGYSQDAECELEQEKQSGFEEAALDQNEIRPAMSVVIRNVPTTIDKSRKLTAWLPLEVWGPRWMRWQDTAISHMFSKLLRHELRRGRDAGVDFTIVRAETESRLTTAQQCFHQTTKFCTILRQYPTSSAMTPISTMLRRSATSQCRYGRSRGTPETEELWNSQRETSGR